MVNHTSNIDSIFRTFCLSIKFGGVWIIEVGLYLPFLSTDMSLSGFHTGGGKGGYPPKLHVPPKGCGYNYT